MIDANTIAIGQKIHYPNKAAKLDEEFHGMLNHSGQHLHLNLELAPSIDEIMSSEQSLYRNLA